MRRFHFDKVIHFYYNIASVFEIQTITFVRDISLEEYSMKQRLMVFVCGLPSAGKSTVGDLIAQRLPERGWPIVSRLDIDDVRKTFMGLPDPHPEASQEAERRDVAQMSEAWNGMFWWMDRQLTREWPCIFTGTLSSQKHGQDRLMAVCANHPEALVKVIWCRIPEGEDTREEIERRMQERGFGAGGYIGATNSYERWVVLRDRYNPITIPHHVLWTPRSRTPQECADEAVAYILGGAL